MEHVNDEFVRVMPHGMLVNFDSQGEIGDRVNFMELVKRHPAVFSYSYIHRGSMYKPRKELFPSETTFDCEEE